MRIRVPLFKIQENYVEQRTEIFGVASPFVSQSVRGKYINSIIDDLFHDYEYANGLEHNDLLVDNAVFGYGILSDEFAKLVETYPLVKGLLMEYKNNPNVKSLNRIRRALVEACDEDLVFNYHFDNACHAKYINPHTLSSVAIKLLALKEEASHAATKLLKETCEYWCDLIYMNDFYYIKFNNLFYPIGSKYKIYITHRQLLEMFDNDNPELKNERKMKRDVECVMRFFDNATREVIEMYPKADIKPEIRIEKSMSNRLFLSIKLSKEEFSYRLSYPLDECDMIASDIRNSGYHKWMKKLIDGFEQEAGKYYLEQFRRKRLNFNMDISSLFDDYHC